MKRILIGTLVLAGLAMPLVPASAGMIISGASVRGAAPEAASQVAQVANKYQCFTDDGYGRKFPCSARYKRENPNWRQGSECMTDEGYGRLRPCDSFFRSGQQGQQGQQK